MNKKILYIVIVAILIVSGCGTSEKNNEPKEDLSAISENENIQEKMMEEFKQDISDILYDHNDEHISLYVKCLYNDMECDISAERMRAASLIKLYVAGCVYENYDIVCNYIGSEEAVEALMEQMITVSDNEALNDLTHALGNGNDSEGKNLVNTFCRKHRYYDTHMGRLLLKKNQKDDNYTSVTDCGKFLCDIYNNKLENSDKILDYMKRQERVSKIPAGIPEGVEVANKTGELSNLENDVAIVFLENNPYIICIMADEVDDPEKMRKSEAEISEKIYFYISREENYE